MSQEQEKHLVVAVLGRWERGWVGAESRTASVHRCRCVAPGKLRVTHGYDVCFGASDC